MVLNLATIEIRHVQAFLVLSQVIATSNVVLRGSEKLLGSRQEDSVQTVEFCSFPEPRC